MIAPPRHLEAAHAPVALPRTKAEGLWSAAAEIRQEWLAVALSTEPADRVTTERNLTAIHARLGRASPRFEWVDSPAKAVPLLGGLPTLDDLFRRVREPVPIGPPPPAAELATLVANLRGGLRTGLEHPDPETSPYRKDKAKNKPWPESPPPDSLRAGVPLPLVLYRGVRESLQRSLRDGVRQPVLAALAALSGGPPGSVPVGWYGQHDASWIAYADLLRRVGLAGYGPGDSTHLAQWAALARSCSWWWPGPDVCVVVERPEELRVEPVRGARYGEIRLRPGGIRYRDGWQP